MQSSKAGVRLASNGAYWLARWIDPQGRRVARSLGAKGKVSQAEARRMCVRIEAEHMVRPATATGIRPATLAEWEARFFTVNPGLKEGTQALYRTTFGRLSDRFGSGARLDRINLAQAQDFVNWLSGQPDQRAKDGRKIGPDTVARHIRDCRRIWELASKAGAVHDNPWRDVRAGACASSEWRYVSEEDFARLRLAAEARSEGMHVLMCLCRYAALRRGEALRLEWSDIDLNRRVIRVQPEPDENGRRLVSTKQAYRTVPISPVLHKILADRAGSGRVVAEDFGTQNLTRDLDSIRTQAKIEEYGKPLHTLRKSCISDWLGMGCAVSDVALWAGHSVDVLMKHYAGVIQTSAAKVTQQGRGRVEQLQDRIAELEAKLAESARKDG